MVFAYRTMHSKAHPWGGLDGADPEGLTKGVGPTQGCTERSHPRGTTCGGTGGAPGGNR